MKTIENKIFIKDIHDGYIDGYLKNLDCGIIGYGGKLNIRPIFQREYVYTGPQREAVIHTILNEKPLGELHWTHDGNDSYEVMDGQQRIISICSFINCEYSITHKGQVRYFHGLSEDDRNIILNRKLTVFFCEGSREDQLDWFETINIVGEKLKIQEILNATYNGSWVTNAKELFSSPNCLAYRIARKYLPNSVTLKRQDLVEIAIMWHSNGEVREYMAKHFELETAEDLLEYFKKVIAWMDKTYIVERPVMKGLDCGKLYNKYHDIEVDPVELESRIKNLLMDDDIDRPKGIYSFVFSGNESDLSIRKFSDNMKLTVFEQQNGVCTKCEKTFTFDKMQGDHITPWSKGGKTNIDNLQMLCSHCNRIKSNK